MYRFLNIASAKLYNYPTSQIIQNHQQCLTQQRVLYIIHKHGIIQLLLIRDVSATQYILYLFGHSNHCHTAVNNICFNKVPKIYNAITTDSNIIATAHPLYTRYMHVCKCCMTQSKLNSLIVMLFDCKNTLLIPYLTTIKIIN